MKKIMSILLTFAMLAIMSIPVFAASPITKLKAPGNKQFTSIGSNVLGYVQWFGYALAVGMLIYIGIKYMMASANEKADLKKGAINYVIGAILVAAAATIVGIMAKIGGEVVGTTVT